jgi:hypothetical protein
MDDSDFEDDDDGDDDWFASIFLTLVHDVLFWLLWYKKLKLGMVVRLWCVDLHVDF